MSDGATGDRRQSGGARLVFSRLHLPRPLQVEQVDAALLRLAADRSAPPLVLEVRAQASEPYVAHLLGTPPEHVRWVQRTLRRFLPGLDFDTIGPEERPAVQRSVRVRIRPRTLALATDRAELISRSILAALDTHLADGEQTAVQVMLGPRTLPQHLAADVAAPRRSWASWLSPAVPAAGSVRAQMNTRVGQHGFRVTIRIGVTAQTSDRRQQLLIGVLGAISTAADRGTYIDLGVEPASRFNDLAVPWRWPILLGVTELTGLLGWPLGDDELPGVAPLHPRALRIPAGVSRTERLFAVSAAPGAQSSVGIAASDLSAHLVAAGPTGVGKSTVLLNLVRADVAAGRPVVVIDPKRQLVGDIVDRAIDEARIDDVVIVDPAMLQSGRVVGFNPLDVGDRDPDVVVDGLVAVLKATFHDGWGPRTEDILHAGLLTLARVGSQRRAPFTMLDLPRLLSDEGFRRPIVGSVIGDPGLGSFWSSYLSVNPAGQAHMIAAPMNKLRQYLLRPSLRAILGQPSPAFRLRDVFRSNKIVLVPLNEALIGPLTAQLLGSLIVAETWSATLERASEPNPTDRPATVVVDEVHQYLHLPVSVDDALSRSRSYGVGWHVAHQHRAQLPPSTRAAVDSNAKSKIIFQPIGPDDAAAFAKQAPDLAPTDFLALGKHQAYANLTAGGRPAGWALVNTMSPPPPTGLGARIRRRSNELYAAQVPATPPPTAHGSAKGEAGQSMPPAPEEPIIGAKKRRRS